MWWLFSSAISDSCFALNAFWMVTLAKAAFLSWSSWFLGCLAAIRQFTWQLSAVHTAIAKNRLICSGEDIRNMTDSPRSYVASPFILLTLKWDGDTAFSWAVPFIPCWKLGRNSTCILSLALTAVLSEKGVASLLRRNIRQNLASLSVYWEDQIFFCQFQIRTLPSLDFWIIKPPNSGSLRWESCWKLRGDALYSCFTSWCMI